MEHHKGCDGIVQGEWGTKLCHALANNSVRELLQKRLYHYLFFRIVESLKGKDVAHVRGLLEARALLPAKRLCSLEQGLEWKNRLERMTECMVRVATIDFEVHKTFYEETRCAMW